MTAPREREDGVNADMVEGMIVAAQQWEQELLMFDNEVTQELEGADCTSSGGLRTAQTNQGLPKSNYARVVTTALLNLMRGCNWLRMRD